MLLETGIGRESMKNKKMIIEKFEEIGDDDIVFPPSGLMDNLGPPLMFIPRKVVKLESAGKIYYGSIPFYSGLRKGVCLELKESRFGILYDLEDDEGKKYRIVSGC